MTISHSKTLLGAGSVLLPLIILWGSARTSPLAPPAGSVPTFAGNAQHTGIYTPVAANLNTIRWSKPIDLNNTGARTHYGAPVITAADTILVPVKIAGDAFRVDAFANDGTAKYSLASDYILPSHNWIPVYNPCLTTGAFGTRLYYAGAGGTVFYIDDPDSASHGAPVRQVFYTSLANYQANAAGYNSTIFINTPLTSDTAGNIFFGFRVEGTAPAPLNTSQSGFARIDPNGNATYILVSAAANDSSILRNPHNSAPALSNDEATLYVVARSTSGTTSYLLGLDSTTFAPKYRALLKDPRNGNPAAVTDDSTSSPTVAPDNDVYFGILGTPASGFRGFLLHFNADLTQQKTPGAFGWDYTPAIVPASMVSSYQGPSSYLIFCKYNSYVVDDGDGVNRVALLDPNTTQLDPHPSAAGLVEMREVLTLIGPRPDEDHYSAQYPYAVREWCINTAAVNPNTQSIFVPNEDGRVYRWNVSTNSFAEAVTLSPGIGEPYVPTIIGPNGTVYTLNGGTLFALGGATGVGLTMISSAPDVRTTVVGEPVTFTATVTATSGPAPTPTGSVTFEDLTYQDLTPVTTVLASDVPLDANGHASVTTSNLAAGNGFLGNHTITATYSGDANYPTASISLLQKVHAQASTSTVSSSPNPSAPGETVTITASVTGGPPSPTGMVTFLEGNTVLAQVPLASGAASFNTNSLSPGDHTIAATYQSDTVCALSSGTTTQTVGIGLPTPTPTPSPASSPTPTPTPSPGPSSSPTPTPTPSATPGSSPGPQPTNLSTRMHVETDDKVGIGGFIISGNTPKRVLVRGIGPSLIKSGISEPLPDPFLELYASGPAPIAVNDNWRDTQEDSIKATGIPPVSDLESAIDVTLSPGNYTAVLRDKDGGAGIALVEVFDLDQASGRLANISTRAFCSTGANIAIAGFILGNQSGADRIVVRGIGPSLAAAGVPDTLSNPSLELRNGDGALLQSNNDWQDNPAQAAQVAAAGLQPQNERESAIAVSLPPGRYFALLAGENEGPASVSSKCTTWDRRWSERSVARLINSLP